MAPRSPAPLEPQDLLRRQDRPHQQQPRPGSSLPPSPPPKTSSATARALGGSRAAIAFGDDSSDDEDGQDDHAAGFEAPTSVLPRPGRAGGMLADQAALGAASALALAPLATPLVVATVNHDASAASPACPAATGPNEVQQVLALPGRAGGMLPDPTSVCPGPVAATAAAIPAPAVAASQEAPAAVRAAVEHHVHAQPSKDSTTPVASNDSSNDPVQATYAHDAAQFECAQCAYVADSMAVLVQHRRSGHRGTRFHDTFTSGCACNLVFYARIVAASHAAACGKRRP
ncbi:Hypothetical protein PHPALM_19416, partial [Phytophthora palmivora]